MTSGSLDSRVASDCPPAQWRRPTLLGMQRGGCPGKGPSTRLVDPAARNYIAGAVTASANLNGTTISGNTIAGALACTTNVPAPTNAGVRHAVGGGRSGQTCAVLTF